MLVGLGPSVYFKQITIEYTRDIIRLAKSLAIYRLGFLMIKSS